jgi:Kef-type K+ transport system membrane component KefB
MLAAGWYYSGARFGPDFSQIVMRVGKFQQLHTDGHDEILRFANPIRAKEREDDMDGCLTNSRTKMATLHVAIFACLFIPTIAWASGAPGNEAGWNLVTIIGVSIIAASALTIVCNRFGLPALLAYVFAGLAIGSFAGSVVQNSLHSLHEVAHIGLVFLLFIIGMEMNPTAIRILGWRTGLVILLQAPISIAALFALQWGLNQIGLSLPGLGQNPESWIYYAVAASLGSTAVVVALLGNKFDLGSQAGKITVMTLIAEDIWAVVALSYVSTQGVTVADGGNSAWALIGGGVMLTAAVILTARFVLSKILERLERSPELLTLVSLGWCFLCVQAFTRIGLSGELGALVAGLTVGRLPQHVEIFSKVVSLKDFFMALFFVALGMSLPPPTLAIIGQAGILIAIVIVTRVLLYTPTLLPLQGPIVSFTVPINLSQLSVFGTLLLPIGVANGALTIQDQTIVLYALLGSVIISAFSIPNNYRIAIAAARKFKSWSKLSQNDIPGHEHEPDYSADIIMLGYFVNGPAITRYIEKNCPELLEKILVIDFNTGKMKQMDNTKLRVVYGDISQPDTLRHFGVNKAKVVISTINNAFLKGTRNEDLLEQIQKINPNAKFIVTTLGVAQADEFMRNGAFACVSTPDESAPAYVAAIQAALDSFETKELAEPETA